MESKWISVLLAGLLVASLCRSGRAQDEEPVEDLDQAETSETSRALFGGSGQPSAAERIISWMDFSKPAISSGQVRQQRWRQPPLPLNLNHPQHAQRHRPDNAGRHPQIGIPWPQQPQPLPQRPEKAQPSKPVDVRPNSPVEMNQGIRLAPPSGHHHHHHHQSGQPQLIVPLPPARPAIPSVPVSLPTAVPVHPARSIESENYFNHVRQQQQQYHYAVEDYEEEQEPEEDYYNGDEEEEEEDEIDLAVDYSTTESSQSSSTEQTPPAEQLHPQEQTSDEDHINMDILTVFGLSGLASLPYTPKTVPQVPQDDDLSDAEDVQPDVDAKYEEDEEVLDEVDVQEFEHEPTTTTPFPRKLPALLPPPTPPGKRVIGAGNQPPVVSKPIDNHRGSYGLSAASVYARLQPSMRFPNASGRPKDIPRPYRKRPVSPSTTPQPVSSAADDEAPVHEPHVEYFDHNEEQEDELEKPEESVLNHEDVNLEGEEDRDEEETHPKDHEQEVPVKEELDEELQVQESEQRETRHDDAESQPKEEQPLTIPEVIRRVPTENETIKPPNVVAQSGSGPVDIKELLRSAGSVSLSEYLQQKGMTLADLLSGGTSALAGMQTNSPSLSGSTKSVTSATTSTPMSTPTSPTPEFRPAIIPDVKPISFRELMAGKNISLSELLGPTLKSGAPLPIPASPTLKPGVKMPVPFSTRFKSLQPSVPTAPTAEERSQEDDDVTTTTTTTTTKPTAALKPLIFGGLSPTETTNDESAEGSTTPSTTTLRTRRPYYPPNNIGEYGSHGPVDDDSDEESNGTKPLFTNFISYGNQRPIATSRLTPPPLRKHRPVLNFNYNTYTEDEEEEGSGDLISTTTTIATHFNEDELREEEEGYFNLPVSVQSAIIVSSTIVGFCLIVFVVILILFKIRQKSRIRLRHPNAALLGALSVSGAGSHTAGSDGSSGVTTPIPPLKGGYAKLPLRSSSLWGTLRRSMRQLDSNFSY